MVGEGDLGYREHSNVQEDTDTRGCIGAGDTCGMYRRCIDAPREGLLTWDVI